MSSVLIVTRTRNRPHLLRRAIGSVLAQTHSDWHHVIVNDGGKKAAVEAEIEARREDYGERVTLVHHARAKGMQAATNAGIAAAESAYVAVHDDDDTWAPEFLERCVQFLEDAGPDSNYQGVITRTEMVLEKVNKAGEIEERSRRPYIPLSEVSLFRMGFENPFPPIAFCFRRAAYDAVGPFDPRYTVAGDYDFNLRFARRFEIGVVDEIAAFYHVREKATRLADKNSITAETREHKIRYNELKNEGLREAEASQPGSLAVALNTARYLVEIEWATHENRKRLHDLPPLLEALQSAVDTHAKNLWHDQHEQHASELKLLEKTLASTAALLSEFTENRSQIEANAQQIAADQKNLWQGGISHHQIEVKLLENLLGKSDQSSGALSSLRERIEAVAKQSAADQKNLWQGGLDQHETEVKLLERLLEKSDHGTSEFADVHKQVESVRQAVFDELNRLFVVTDFDAREARMLERLERLAEQTAGDHRNFWVDLNERTGELSHALAAFHKSLTADLTLRSQEFSRSLHQLHDTLATANANLWKDTNQRSREVIQAVEAHGESLSSRITGLHQNGLEPLLQQLGALIQEQAAFRSANAETSRVVEQRTQENAEISRAIEHRTQANADQLAAVSDRLEALQAAQAAETSIISLGPLRLTWRRKPKPSADGEEATEQKT